MKKKTVKYYKGNTLKQLRAFCSVARTGKMTDTADELFLSQSAISLQIKALEDEMHKKLENIFYEVRDPLLDWDDIGGFAAISRYRRTKQVSCLACWYSVRTDLGLTTRETS